MRALGPSARDERDGVYGKCQFLAPSSAELENLLLLRGVFEPISGVECD